MTSKAVCKPEFPISFATQPATLHPTASERNSTVGFAVRGASAIMEGVSVSYLVQIPASTSEAKLTLKTNASTLTE